jgi:hypothetical protein
MPSDMAFRTHFGSWGNALNAAGFKPTKFIPIGAKKGKRNKQRKKVGSHGYIHIFEPSHPMAMKNGYVREHRKIAYDAGLIEDPKFEVHHINGNKKDNRLENLEVLTKEQHASLTHLGSRKKIKNGKVCKHEGCLIITGSKYELCRTHYKSYWAKLNRKPRRKVIIHENAR